MVKLSKTHETDPAEMRAAYCDALIEAAKEDPRIVSINCDLESSCGVTKFRNAFPDRSFNLGIMEANACGVAAGMAVTGLIPFFHSFAIFSSRRIYDQIFLSCAYAGLPVKIIGFDAGVSATYNGGTHMAFEDVAMMRAMPNLTVLEPSDTVMTRSLVKEIMKLPGAVYMRMPRKTVPRIYENGACFQIGKAALLQEGRDVTIIASGMEVIEALRAAQCLAEQGIAARVVDLFTIKPIDQDFIIRCAKETGAIVTAENANILGSLGGAVAEILAEHCPTPMERVGVADEFGEVGQQDYLKERFGLLSSNIVEKAKRAIARKNMER